MNTQMKLFEKRIENMKKVGTYEVAMSECLNLMLDVIERNRIGRALERAMKKVLDDDTIAEIYKEALFQSHKPDDFTSDECEFFKMLAEIRDEMHTL